MVIFKPFRAILPELHVLDKVVTRPFDSYTREESAEVLASNPLSFLHVIVPVQDARAKATTPYDEILNLGREKLASMMAEGTLVREEEPCFFLYQQVKEGHVYTGIIGLAHVGDYEGGRIRKHEQTLEHKEELLKQYLDTIDIHAEPVYLVFENNVLWDNLKEAYLRTAPYASFSGPDGFVHTFWKIQNEADLETVEMLFAAQRSVYIADGHHRCAASYLYGRDKASQSAEEDPQACYNYFLAAALPETEARLFEFSRLVRDLNGYTGEQFISLLAEKFHIQKSTVPVIPVAPHEFGVCLADGWYVLNLKREFLKNDHPADGLDPELANIHIFGPVLQVHDLRKDKRVKFIGGKTDAPRLEQAVRSGKFAAAFTFYPVRMELFKQMADAGEMMPPKSTFFEPKFLNGLFIYKLSEE